MSKPKKRPRTTAGGFRAQLRPFKAALLAGKDLDYSDLRRLKDQPIAVIRAIAADAGFRPKDALGLPFPTSYGTFSSPPVSPRNEHNGAELRWTTGVLLSQAPQLIEFLALKEQFDKAFLLGSYVECSTLLASIDKLFGKSIWSLEVDLLLAQQRGGFEANRARMQELSEISPTWVKILLHFLSFKAETTFSISEYRRQQEQLIPTTPEEAKKAARAIAIYLRHRLDPYHPFDKDASPYLLNLEEPHSYPDRLLQLIYWAKLEVAANPSSISSLRPVVGSLHRELADSSLATLMSITNPGRTSVNELTRHLLTVLDQYTEGDYAGATKASTLFLTLHPTHLDFYDVTCKCALRANQPAPAAFRDNSLSQRILSLVWNVVSHDDSSSEAVLSLRHLAYRLSSFAIGPQLFAFTQQYLLRQSPLEDRLSLLLSCAQSPRLACAFGSYDDSLLYLSQLADIYGRNAGITLFETVFDSLQARQYIAPRGTLPKYRQIKHEAYVYETLGNHARALSLYEAVQDSHADVNPDYVDAVSGQLRCHLQLGQISEGVRVLAKVAITSRHLLSHTILCNLLAQYDTTYADASDGEIGWPILFSVAQQEGLRELDNENLHDAIDDFLTNWGVRRPSELRSHENDLDRDCLLYFLRELCVPEILDSSIWYDTQDELEAERIRICEWLIALNPEARDEYNLFIADLTKKSTIRELTHNVERSRVFVDVSGIRESLSTNTHDRIARFITFGTLTHAALRQGIELTVVSLENLRTSGIRLLDASYSLFKSCFEDIRHLFISSNQYGLDSNLSQRIRHGTLSGEIRAHFERQRLVTQKHTNGDYLSNDFWLSRLSDQLLDRDAADQVLKRLSSDVDNIVSLVRNKWVQIKGPTNPDGLFDFDFSEADILAICDKAADAQSEDTLLDVVFNALWERTEGNLSQVRQHIDTELKRLLFKALDDCQTSFEIMLGTETLADFRDAVTSVRTSLGNGLVSLAEWFHVDQTQRVPDFRFSVLLDAILGVIGRVSGPAHLDVQRTGDESLLFPGSEYRALWDLLLIALQNCAQHGPVPICNTDVTIEEVNGHATLRVANPLKEETDESALRETIAPLFTVDIADSELGLIRREGGSGLAKMQKILKYDMGRRNSTVECDITADRVFLLTVTFGDRRQPA